MKPLEGIKVLDFTRVLAGPFATKILADFGADVIKIERTGLGDDTRSFGPFQNGLSGYFVYLNTGKKSVELNLKDADSICLLKEMVKDIDVIIENFRPGIMRKFNLDYSSIKTIKPEIIYASISGFGQEGIWSEKPAYDLIAQATGGIMSINGYPETPPTRVGASLGDTSAGLNAAIGIITALFHRERTGEGQHIDVAMVDSIYALLESNVMRYTVEKKIPQRIGNRHPISAPFDIYQTKEGYLAIAIANDSLFDKFCRLINREDMLLDPRFYTDSNRQRYQKSLKAEIENWLYGYTAVDAADLLEQGGIPCSVIFNVKDISESDYIREREMLVDINQSEHGTFRIPGNPIKLSSVKQININPAPKLGEHTEAVLAKYKEMIK